MADEWTHEGAQPITVRASSHGGWINYRVIEARMHHSMYDAHPIHGTSSPVSSATLLLRNANDHDLTGAAPDPLSRPDNWPPADGLGMEVDVGDGRPSGWRRQLTGIVTGTSGSLSSPVVEVEVADDMKPLQRLVTSGSPTLSDAIYTRLPPHPDGDGRPIDLHLNNIWLADRVARAAGYYASARPRWQKSRLVVPMMGSILPEIGTIIAGGNREDGSPSHPRRDVTPWGLSMSLFDATYKPTSNVGLPFEIVLDLPTRKPEQDVSAPASVRLIDNDGRTLALVYNHANDLTYIQWVPGWGQDPVNLVTLPRAGASRVAMRVTSTQASLRRDIDSSATTVNHGLSLSGWSGSKVRTWAQQSSLGGITVDANPTAWDTLQAPRTARIRTRLPYAVIASWTVAPNTFEMSRYDVLCALADAECGQWWISSDGVLEFAAAGVLEAQAPAAEVTSLTDLADLRWSTSIGNMSESVRIEWRQPRVRAAHEQTIEVWRGGESGLESGDLWETWATPPDDEDWIGVDTTLHKVGTSSTAEQMRIGSVLAVEAGSKTDYDMSAWDYLTAGLIERVTQRAYKLLVSPLAGSGNIVNIKWPDGLGSARNFRRSWEGEDGFILRATTRVTWAEQRSPAHTTGATGSEGEYVHHAGRFVQREDHLAEIETWLVGELGSGLPAVTLDLRANPDLEVGQIVRVKDRARTGLTIDLLIQQIDPTWRPGDADMTISGRVTAWEIDTTIRDKAAPLPHWIQLQSGHGSTGTGGSYGD